MDIVDSMLDNKMKRIKSLRNGMVILVLVQEITKNVKKENIDDCI